MVRDVRSGVEYSFKPADDTLFHSSASPASCPRLRLNLRTSRLASLVYYDREEPVLLGMVLGCIEEQTPAVGRMSAPASDRRRCADQMEETVGTFMNVS